jgi:NAD+ synthase (glutamine-hydrolysing)
LNGANLIVNLSGSNETISKTEYRRDIVRTQSAKCLCAYAYASSGISESTTDLIFSGHKLIAENGALLAESIFDDAQFISCDIDLDKLLNDRTQQMSFFADSDLRADYTRVAFDLELCDYAPSLALQRDIDPFPFVPSERHDLVRRSEEILNLQVLGLYGRMKATGARHAVIGISGGLDSTLALLVTAETFKKLGYDLRDIHCVTMPCFGTSARTYRNAGDLVRGLGCTLLDIPISESVKLHLTDIGQPLGEDGDFVRDIAYENAQARERTQVLMDYANKVGGFVVGTGDLSELALGWCTYNGDHMSMYAVNVSIPKTLVKYMIRAYAENEKTAANIGATLRDITDTPISPELLPPDENGEMQKTESAVGSYDLNDFYLYHILRSRFNLRKIYILALRAFPHIGAEEIFSSLRGFYLRFYTQQFKRSCLPDGVKVGSVCLSPRGDWRCPSDVTRDTLERHLARLEEYHKAVK